MHESNPPTVRNSQYVALCLLNLMPDGWDDERTPRSRCRDAARGQPLNESKAVAHALQVLRDVALPAEPPEFVRRWRHHHWYENTAPDWEAGSWKGDYWMWQVTREAAHWDERLADYAGRFGRGRQTWWAYAELWVIDIAIRWAIAEMLPAPMSLPAPPFAKALEQRSVSATGKPAKEVLLRAAREQRGKAPSDDTITSWTSEVRKKPRWDNVSWASQQFPGDDERGLVRSIMLENAVSLADAETRDRVAALKKKFERVYEATRLHGLDAEDLRSYDAKHRASLLVSAAIEGSGSIGTWIIGEHLAAREDLQDLRDDLLAASLGLSRWAERLLSKLGDEGPTPDQRGWSPAMDNAYDLLVRANIIGNDAHIEQYPVWKDRPPLVMCRPPQNAEIKTCWEEALRLCKQEIEGDDAPSRDGVDGGWVPYAMGYAIMCGLGMPPREMWRKEAIRRGGNRADPKLHPRESFKPGGRTDVAQCFWLRFCFSVATA